MCSIVVLEGDFKGNHLIELLRQTKDRGVDSTGIFLDGDVFLDVDLDNLYDDHSYSFALGHNLLSIFNLEEGMVSYQPIRSGNLILVFNGEIYNFKDLSNFLNKYYTDGDCFFLTDGFLLVSLIKYFYQCSGNLLSAVKSTILMLDGDYSFCVYDGEDLVAVRDPLGVKPLFYSKSDYLNVISSSKCSLKNMGFDDIESLKPNEILYNWESVVVDEGISSKKIILSGDIKKQLRDLLESAVLKRVCYLDEIAVIFSGGIDSTILVFILYEISKSRSFDIKLYTVGSEKSLDVKFAHKLAEYLDLPLKVQDVTAEIVKENLDSVKDAICDDNIMKLGVGMTIYLASKMIHDDGIRVAFSGQGADELFAGYNRYLKSFSSGGLEDELRYDIGNMYHVNLERDDAVSMVNGVELRVPFLDKELVEFSLNVSADYKISGVDDNIRKNILRDIAGDLGLPDEFVYRPKKAAQYATGIDKILRKILKD